MKRVLTNRGVGIALVLAFCLGTARVATAEGGFGMPVADEARVDAPSLQPSGEQPNVIDADNAGGDAAPLSPFSSPNLTIVEQAETVDTSPITLGTGTELYSGTGSGILITNTGDLDIEGSFRESITALESISSGVLDGTIKDLPNPEFFQLYGQIQQGLTTAPVVDGGALLLAARAENPDNTEYCARLKSILETNWSDTIKHIYNSILAYLYLKEQKGNVKILTLDPKMEDVQNLIKMKFALPGNKKVEITFERQNPKIKIVIELGSVGTDEKKCKETLDKIKENAHGLVVIKLKIGDTDITVNLNQLKSIMSILTLAEFSEVTIKKIVITEKGDLLLTVSVPGVNRDLTLKFTAAELEASYELAVPPAQADKVTNWLTLFKNRLEAEVKKKVD